MLENGTKMVLPDVIKQGRRWTQPSAWKWISPAERSGEASRERAQHEQGDLQISRAEQHGSSRERWLCPGGSRSSGWISEPAAPGCRRTQGLHTPRAYRFARIVICKWHGKCHESSW
ncbi:uncharacterized protein RBU47_003827 isoform 1-T1 [Passerculus sandwichensis]